MYKWYVVQVFSTQEKKIKKALEENADLKGMTGEIEQILIPTENVSEVKKGQQHIVEKRLWPGYILIKMNMTDDSWHYVKSTNGVIEFMGGNKPTPLTDSEVENILKDLQDNKQRVIQKHKFEIGDKVKITEGVFVNFSGSIVEIAHDKGRLSVLVSIFGRETKVEDLEFSQVEEINDDSELG